jgi:hypothetical protein
MSTSSLNNMGSILKPVDSLLFIDDGHSSPDLRLNPGLQDLGSGGDRV